MNYNKNRCTVCFKPKQRVWVRDFPPSRFKDKFTAKLAKKWTDPSRIVQQLGPLNYEVVIPVLISELYNHQPFYPNMEDLEVKDCRRILNLLQESSDKDEFFIF